jgi:aspartokinase/homoserine dehydrogenase 1
MAKENGYTEPNPWDDLNGLDVARKIVILARYAGHKVSINDVEVEPLIDKKY